MCTTIGSAFPLIVGELNILYVSILNNLDYRLNSFPIKTLTIRVFFFFLVESKQEILTIM